MKCYLQKGRHPNGSVNMKHTCTYIYSTVHTQKEKKMKENSTWGKRERVITWIEYMYYLCL
jgi:hypothetical protein